MIATVVVAATLAARAGLKALLSADEQIDVIAEAATLLDLNAISPPAEMFVVLAGKGARPDWSSFAIPDDPPPGVLLLADDPGLTPPLGQLPLRAWGLLETDCSEDELLAAFFAVYQGLVTGTAALMQPLIGKNTSSQINEDGFEIALTERERQVLGLLAEGMANKQISYHLGISEHTVKFHVSSIYAKLGVSNRAEAVRMGIQLGLVMF